MRKGEAGGIHPPPLSLLNFALAPTKDVLRESQHADARVVRGKFRPRIFSLGITVLILVADLLVEAEAAESDWPQWRGPTRDGR